MKIHSVLACDAKWGIARGSYMPWRLKREYAYFTKLTSDTSHTPGRMNALVMGRKTWEEETAEGRVHPLPNRYNFVISRSLKEIPEGANGIASTVEELVEMLESPQWKDKIGMVFNGGGSDIYKYIHDSKFCGRIYVTRIKRDFDCDVFVPVIEKDSRFQRVSKSEPYEDIVPDGEQEEDGIKWEVQIYGKVPPQQ